MPFRIKSILSFWIIHQISMQKESWIFFSILQFSPYSFKWRFLDTSIKNLYFCIKKELY